MTRPERADKLLDELSRTLETAAEIVTRGRADFDSDIAVSLAFEALSNRVGDLSKQLLAADPQRFPEPDWMAAARNRDAIVHHYQRIIADRLWNTVTVDFPALQTLVNSRRNS